MTKLTLKNFPARLDKISQHDDYCFNCWNFTAQLEGWTSVTRWFDDYEMESYLDERTETIDRDDLRFGDIVVFRDDDDTLTHTGVYTNDDEIIHKPGSMSIEIMEINQVCYEYPYGHVSEFRRVKRAA